MQKILRVLRVFFLFHFFSNCICGDSILGAYDPLPNDDRYAVVPTLEQKRLFGWMENLFLSFGLCYLWRPFSLFVFFYSVHCVVVFFLWVCRYFVSLSLSIGMEIGNSISINNVPTQPHPFFWMRPPFSCYVSPCVWGPGWWPVGIAGPRALSDCRRDLHSSSLWDGWTVDIFDP